MIAENRTFGRIIGTWRYTYGGEDYVQLTFTGDSAKGTAVCEDYDDGDGQSLASEFTFQGSILKMPKLRGGRSIKVVSLSEDSLVLKGWPHGGDCIFHRQTDDKTYQNL